MYIYLTWSMNFLCLWSWDILILYYWLAMLSKFNMSKYSNRNVYTDSTNAKTHLYTHTETSETFWVLRKLIHKIYVVHLVILPCELFCFHSPWRVPPVPTWSSSRPPAGVPLADVSPPTPPPLGRERQDELTGAG